MHHTDLSLPLPSPPPPWLVRAALWLHRRLTELAFAIVPPEVRVFDLAIGGARAQSVGMAVRVGLFDLLAQPATSAEVAAALGVDEDASHRCLRALATLGLLEVWADGRFVNTAAGRACMRGSGSAAFVEYFTAPSTQAAFAQLERSLRTGQSGFLLAHGRSVWDHFEEHPEELELFAEAMAHRTQMDAAALAVAWPFGELESLCDVGAGRGTLAAELLVRYPRLHVTLLDREGVLCRAARHLQQRGVRERATLVPGSFFEAVPPGQPAYLLKNILHDWDDQACVRILANVRRAAPAGARLLVVEERQELLELGPTSLGDIGMMVLCEGGRERSESQYASLMQRAGFHLTRSHRTGSLLWIFEGLAR
jgi:hypothetical protein